MNKEENKEYYQNTLNSAIYNSNRFDFLFEFCFTPFSIKIIIDKLAENNEININNKISYFIFDKENNPYFLFDLKNTNSQNYKDILNKQNKLSEIFAICFLMNKAHKSKVNSIVYNKFIRFEKILNKHLNNKGTLMDINFGKYFSINRLKKITKNYVEYDSINPRYFELLKYYKPKMELNK